MLGGLCIEAIDGQTAKQDPITVSGGADSRDRASGGVLEQSEGLVLLQALREVLGGLCIEVIIAQTAEQDPITVSGGADTFVCQCKALTPMMQALC